MEALRATSAYFRPIVKSYTLVRLLRFLSLLLLGLAFSIPQSAYAGMPVVRLSDWAAMRIDTISFFLGLMLLVAWVFQLLWNYLQKDFSRLPRLVYSRALVLTFTLGLGMSLVLSMISGARELFTPGAWQKNELTYKIAPLPSESAQLLHVRKEKILQLKDALWSFAQGHDQTLPINAFTSTLSPDLFRTAHPSRMHYEYRADKEGLKGPVRALVWEPDIYENDRLVLYTDGRIESLSKKKLEAMIKGRQ